MYSRPRHTSTQAARASERARRAPILCYTILWYIVCLEDKVEIPMATMLLYMTYDPEWVSTLNALQLYRIGLLDPEGLKVKKEVHPRSKSDKKRWRLIFLGSARLEILHRILHGPQNALEMAMYQSGYTHHPSCETFGSCA